MRKTKKPLGLRFFILGLILVLIAGNASSSRALMTSEDNQIISYDNLHKYYYSFSPANYVFTENPDWEEGADAFLVPYYLYYPVTTNISDERERTMTVEGLTIKQSNMIDPTMDDAYFLSIIDGGYPPGAHPSMDVYLPRKPGYYTFALTEEEFGGINNMQVNWRYPLDPYIYWFAQMLSSGDSVKFEMDGDMPTAVIFNSSHESKEFRIVMYHYSMEVLDYGIFLNFDMRDEETVVAKVDGGVILSGASGFRLEIAVDSDRVRNEIKFDHMQTDYATVFIDQRNGEVTFLTFRDIPDCAWYRDAVYEMSDLSLMNGVSDRDFSPVASVSRGMLATIIHRMARLPVPDERHGFEDVLVADYYDEAISWCAAQGIVRGHNNTIFDPDAPITREQLAAIMIRYLEHLGVAPIVDTGISIGVFSDSADISGYAREAMDDAVKYGLLQGKEGNRLDPQGIATRAEAAVILQRLLDLLKQ